ncbi:hypothetical protein GOP47_0012217 [Adiantum capillus-veneris]|uniref:Uncharacterized protein n=1 Tax=Adiantum capillus-veneris TaxID=13818 RepID=A0A9D4UQI7_ADICA|nr:hypothetical protein GOP47_0012217 [Adiantum capillus-veneris]
MLPVEEPFNVLTARDGFCRIKFDNGPMDVVGNGSLQILGMVKKVEGSFVCDCVTTLKGKRLVLSNLSIDCGVDEDESIVVVVTFGEEPHNERMLDIPNRKNRDVDVHTFSFDMEEGPTVMACKGMYKHPHGFC